MHFRATNACTSGATSIYFSAWGKQPDWQNRHPVKPQLTYSKVYLYMANVSARVQSTQTLKYPLTHSIMYNAIKNNMSKPVTPQAIGRHGEILVINEFTTFGYDLGLAYVDNSRMNKNKEQTQVRLTPNCKKKLKKMGRKQYITPDGIIINKLTGNKLYVEVKMTQKISTTLWIEIAERYSILGEQVLFILPHDCITADKINDFNYEIAKKGFSQYALAISIHDFKKCVTPWANQIKNDLKSLKTLMLH